MTNDVVCSRIVVCRGNKLHRRLMTAVLCFALVVIGAGSSIPRAAAQSTWSKMKQQFLQQACKGGDQNACQQLAKLSQKQPQQQAQPQQSGEQPQTVVPARYQPKATAATSSGAEPDSSCCTAAAMKTMAAQAGSVDMVGIKLGMTPQQARAAIKAHNPALALYQLNMRLYQPGAKNFVPVPHFILATNNPPGRSLPVGQEIILLEFTTPPSSPVVTNASRYTTFAPTLAGNLVAELEKKYGPEYPRTGPRSWVYDSSGRPVTAPSRAVDACASGMYGPLGGRVPEAGAGASAPESDTTSDKFDVDTYKYAQSSATAPNVACIPYVVIQAQTLYTNVNPNSQLTQILTVMSSGGLNYASMRSTADWLQAQADAQAKAAHDAAAKNTGTTF